MLLWMEMPWAASAFTMRPFWYQSTCMSWATKEAWHWKGRLSPWKTTCRWDGVSWKDGSSSGASGGGGGGDQNSHLSHRNHTFLPVRLRPEPEEFWEHVTLVR